MEPWCLSWITKTLDFQSLVWFEHTSLDSTLEPQFHTVYCVSISVLVQNSCKCIQLYWLFYFIIIIHSSQTKRIGWTEWYPPNGGTTTWRLYAYIWTHEWWCSFERLKTCDRTIAMYPRDKTAHISHTSNSHCITAKNRTEMKSRRIQNEQMKKRDKRMHSR